jgi:hypothetical protein
MLHAVTPHVATTSLAQSRQPGRRSGGLGGERADGWRPPGPGVLGDWRRCRVTERAAVQQWGGPAVAAVLGRTAGARRGGSRRPVGLREF